MADMIALPAVDREAPAAAQGGEEGMGVALAGHEAVEAAPRLEHAGDLGHGRAHVGHMLQQVEQHDHIELAVGVGQVEGVAPRVGDLPARPPRLVQRRPG